MPLMFAAIDYDLYTVTRVCGAIPASVLLPDIRLNSVTTSSLEVKPGSLFVPLTEKRDGHDFIPDALRRGADAFLVRKGHRILRTLDAQALQKAVIVEEPIKALGKLAHFHRNRFSPLVIAVTGSNGKTTTKEMLGQIFRKALGNRALHTESNYNNHIGVPFTLFRINRRTRVAVVEMGMNHAGEISYLSRMAAPHIAVISSIGHAHIEYLGSRRNIARAKSEILDGAAPGTRLYVPAGVAELATITASARTQKAVLQKIIPGKHTSMKVRRSTPAGYELELGRERVMFRYANAAWLSNLALAVAVASEAGIPAEKIAGAIQAFRAPGGRMQVHRGFFQLIDDGYNANPDSAVASIAAARQFADGRPVVCVFGDFKELGKFSSALHTWTGKEAAKLGATSFYGVGPQMQAAVRAFRAKAGKTSRALHFSRERVDALVAAIAQEPKGSVVLVKGSRSMRMEEIVAHLEKLPNR